MRVVNDIQMKCRLCLSDTDNNLSIFDSQFCEGIPLSLKIMVCVSLTVTPGDSLPKRICPDCTTLVNRFYQFRETCMNTYMKLMQYSNTQDSSQVSSTSEVLENKYNEKRRDDAKTTTPSKEHDADDTCEVEENYISELQFVDDAMETVTVICQEFEEIVVSTDGDGENVAELKKYHDDESIVLPISSSEDSYELATLKGEELNNEKLVDNVANTLEEGCFMQLEKLSETMYALKPLSKRIEGNNNLTSGVCRQYKCNGCERTFSTLSSLYKHWDTCQQDEVANSDEPSPDEGHVDEPLPDEGHMEELSPDEGHVEELSPDKGHAEELLPDKENKMKHKKQDECGNKSEEDLQENALPKKMPESYKRARYGERRKYPCQTCGKVFKVPAMLRNHERVHTGERPFLCSLCSRSFTQLYALRYHEQQHRGESPYPCEQCGKGFYRPSDLEKHMRSHTGERPFMCSVCSKAFHQLSGLIVHERIHTGERPYTCSFCSMNFNQWANKQRHEKTHAGGAKPYSCDTCHRKFSERKDLELHCAGHGGGRPRSCQYCSKSFRKPSELKDHLRRIHTNERPYQCSFCFKAFFAPHELKQHLMVHTGERPFSCSLCLRTFTQKGNLKRHHERHHKSNSMEEEETTLIVEEVDMDDMHLTQLESVQ